MKLTFAQKMEVLGQTIVFAVKTLVRLAQFQMKHTTSHHHRKAV